MFRQIAILAAVFTLFSAFTSLAQDLFGIEWSGNVIRIDKTTGLGAFVGHSGFAGTNSAASDSLGRIFTIIGIPGGRGQLIEIDPTTGGGSVFLELPGCSTPMSVRGMAFNSIDTLYIVLDRGDTRDEDVLATIDMTTGECSEIGTMGLTGVQALAFDPQDDTGGLFCLNVSFPRGLCDVDVMTGVAINISGDVPSGDYQALEFDDDDTLLAARRNLLRLDSRIGAVTIIGATGFDDIRGLAFSAAAPSIQVVEIDIKPRSESNCLNNNGNGKIAVAILGSTDLDAAQVDPSTVALEGLIVAMNGNGTKFLARIRDINKDAFDDLLVLIKNMAGVFEPGDETARLTGELFDGTLIAGSDSICVVPKP